MNAISLIIIYPGEKRLSFTLPKTYADIPHEELLEKIFAWFNHGSGRECDVFLSEKIRSLSVNDFVCIDGHWWQCESVGWKRCNGAYVQEICDAVKQHPSFSKYGAWSATADVMFQKKKSLTVARN